MGSKKLHFLMSLMWDFNLQGLNSFSAFLTGERTIDRRSKFKLTFIQLRTTKLHLEPFTQIWGLHLLHLLSWSWTERERTMILFHSLLKILYRTQLYAFRHCWIVLSWVSCRHQTPSAVGSSSRWDLAIPWVRLFFMTWLHIIPMHICLFRFYCLQVI